MLPKNDWAALIPHAGTMCLLDAVCSWDERRIHAISTSHARADNPLRGACGLHAVHPGRLVSLREVALSEEYVDRLDGPLDVYAECLYADDGSAQYVFRVEHRGRPLASGRAAVIHPAA